MTDTSGYVTLDVHPSVVFKLGEDLISDEVQALVELVKNSYDADATWARVTVDTSVTAAALTYRARDKTPLEIVEGSDQILASELLVADQASDEELVGTLIIEDNGIAMTPDVIQEGWLVISNSHKRAMKRAGRKTAKKRTPLGDKGLGRLGAQRLGSELEIVTRPPKSAVQYRIRIPWHVFTAASRLGQVSFPLIEEEPTFARGTRLTVYGLSDIALWHDRRLDLTQSLSSLVSPFPHHKEVDLSVRIDGVDLDLVRLSDRMRDTAEVRYRIDYADQTLSVVGRADIEYFRPPDRAADEHADFRRLVEKDAGNGFFNWFARRHKHQTESWHLTYESVGGRAFVKYNLTDRLADLDKTVYINGALADPGPFVAEIDAFSLDSGNQSVFDSVATYRDYFKSIAGIKLYRNGFGIRMPDDWLQLGKRWSGGSSYYNLKPTNVVGFVDLTAEHNSQLEEMTDREGLQSSPYLTNFRRLMERWRAFTEQVQTGLRRAYNDYRKEMTQRDGGMDSDTSATPEDVARELRNRARARQQESRRQGNAIQNARDTLSELSGIAGELVEDGADLTGSEAYQRASVVESGIRQVRTAVTLLAEAQAKQDHVAEQEATLLGALQQQLEQVREQLAMSYEAVALGITAEALSHEVHQIADRLAQRTVQTRRRLQDDDALTSPLADYLEYVRSQATALNRQMAHLNPALRFARERRTQIAVLAFLDDIADYYNQRWRGSDRERRIVAVVDPASKDFTVRLNAGRLTQIVDNLVLNSEYWLRAQDTSDLRIRRGAGSKPAITDLPLPVKGDGQITLSCRPRQITVADNGPGVAPNIEATLFDPFVTQKREGRGLGLFISQQLLEGEGGRLRLDDERNLHGRRYLFTIDLAGVAS